MEGSETGWRPAEPAPRWRALLDRARFGGRAAEHAELDVPGDVEPPAPAPWRAAGNGYTGPGSTIGHSAELTRGTEPSPYGTDLRDDAGHRPAPTYPVDQTLPADPGYRVPVVPRQEPRYTEPEPPPPIPPRYALLDNRYRRPPAEPGYAPPEIGYQPPPPPPPTYPSPAADRGYARMEWRAQPVESERDRATAVLRRELGGPRVIAFANPKGGVHKTTATVLAAATVGSVRGRGVVAWDDNELRGTLGLRAGSARHARTIRHLISDLAHIEIKEGPDLTAALDDYLRHAADGSYDVLAGEESPRFAARLDQFTVRRVLELLRRTHQVICVDTGNNVESPNWRSVMQTADQLVVTTVPREDAAFSADWMLDLLHEVGMGELADNAVTLISCPTPGRSALQGDLERHFATRTRAVTVVPYDPALESGSSIEYQQIQPATREAWLAAAAVMLEPFGRAAAG